MADILYFNGRFTTTDEPVVNVEDRGLQYGDSLYEVIKFLERSPRFARTHWDRLSRGMEYLSIPSPWKGWKEYSDLLTQLLERTQFDEGIVYVQVTRGASERAHFYPDSMEPTVIAYSRRFDFPDDLRRRRGVEAVTFDDLRWKRCDVKSVNLLPNVLAKTHARRSGAGEVILIEDGVVTEGASSNIFVVSGDRIMTHPGNSEILSGVVREKVIGLAIRHGFRLDERPVRDDELLAIDELFLTSTTQGVMPVTSINGRRIKDGTPGPVTARLQILFEELERSEDAIDPAPGTHRSDEGMSNGRAI